MRRGWRRRRGGPCRRTAPNGDGCGSSAGTGIYGAATGRLCRGFVVVVSAARAALSTVPGTATNDHEPSPLRPARVRATARIPRSAAPADDQQRQTPELPVTDWSTARPPVDQSVTSPRKAIPELPATPPPAPTHAAEPNPPEELHPTAIMSSSGFRITRLLLMATMVEDGWAGPAPPVHASGRQATMIAESVSSLCSVGPVSARWPHTFGDHERWRVAGSPAGGAWASFGPCSEANDAHAPCGEASDAHALPAGSPLGDRRRVWIALEVAQCSDT